MSNTNYLPLIEEVLLLSDRIDIKINSILFKKGYVLDDFYLKVENTNLEEIPHDILMVPFILNIVPVIWISGLKFEIESIDGKLAESLVDLKKALQEMYPNVKWDGELKAKQTTMLECPVIDNSCVMLFSGGLDSVATSYRHLEEKQTLVTMKGADIKLDDEEGWKIVRTSTIDFAKSIDANYCFVVSNAMIFLNQDKLSISAKVPGWWVNIQHGMGLSGMMSVAGWLSGSSIGYIASSQSLELYDNPYGSHPKIDNKIKWSGLQISHDCDDLSRRGKIELIIRKVLDGKPIPFLRVCVTSRGGKNCGICEKCCRTMNALFAAGVKFQKYGFMQSNSELIRNTKNGLSSNKFVLCNIKLFDWQDKQANIKDNQYYIDREYSEESLNYIEWFKAFDFYEYKEKNEKKNLLRGRIRNYVMLVPGLFPILRTIKNIFSNKNNNQV